MSVTAINNDSLRKTFQKFFGQEPLLVRSPGRVNIIGEHTDYNQGFVLPAAIDKAAYVAVALNKLPLIRLYSVEYDQRIDFPLEVLKPSDLSWPNYVLGVADQLRKDGVELQGFDLVLDADIPIGAGLSSSAAVECAVVFALNSLYGLGMERMKMVKLAQLAEHQFAGVMCGIMDQFASMFGKKDHVVRLDCRSLQYEYIPLRLEGMQLLLLNTNVKHSLAGTAYNKRREECEQGVSWVNEIYPGTTSLRDVTPEQLSSIVKPKDELIYTRCSFVVEENLRLLAACDNLLQGNMKGLGEKMFRTHEGLSKEYEVSCRELDVLVNAVKNEPAVLGARMMGGGFGGCTINLVKKDAVDAFEQKMKAAYQEKYQIDLPCYKVKITTGTEEII